MEHVLQPTGGWDSMVSDIQVREIHQLFEVIDVESDVSLYDHVTQLNESCFEADVCLYVAETITPLHRSL